MIPNNQAQMPSPQNEVLPFTITVEKAQSYIKSKKHMYEAMVRNGFYMPQLKSSIISVDYM
jgi:hypothetical protein